MNTIIRCIAISVMLQVSAMLAEDAASRTVIERADKDGNGVPEEVREVTMRSGETIMETVKRDSTGDGQFNFTRKIIYSGGVRVFTEVTDSTFAFRVYERAGQLVMIENDEDRDGIFELVMLYDEAKEVNAVLTRTTDGQIVPASRETASRVMKSKKDFDGTVGRVMEALIENVRKDMSEQ